MSNNRSPFSIPLLPKLALVFWMGAAVFVFVATSISLDGPIAALAPKFLLYARALLFPFFNAAAIS